MAEKSSNINKKKQSKMIESAPISLSEKIKNLMKTILKTHSLKKIANFLKIFRSSLNEENIEKINLDEGDIFNDMMQFALTKLPEILKEILDLVSFVCFFV